MYDCNKIPFFSAVHPRFNAGSLHATNAVLALRCPEQLRHCLGRHLPGDWGIVEASTGHRNEANLRARTQVMSAYAVDPTKPCTRTENCVWLVTDLGLNHTSFLLPSDF
jgi:hypothetical protein